MKTLLALFDEGRTEIQQRLDAADRLQEVVSIAQHELDRIQKRHLGDLTVPQARVVSPMVAVLRVTVGTLATASKTKVWHAAPVRARDSGKPLLPTGPKVRVISHLTGIPVPVVHLGVLRLRVLQGIVCAGLLTGLHTWTRETWTAWPGMLLILCLVALELLAHRRSMESAGRGLGGEETRVEVRVDSALFLDTLASALDAIDRAMPEPAGLPGDDAGPRKDLLDTAPELLEVIQNLLAESIRDDAQLTLKRSKELPDALERHGIQVAYYQPAETAGADTDSLKWFDAEPSLDPAATECKTLKPALVRDGRPLLRGRVVMPVA